MLQTTRIQCICGAIAQWTVEPDLLTYPQCKRYSVPRTGWETKCHSLCQLMPGASPMKLEFLAMKWARTRKFWHYFPGRHFIVITDNNLLLLCKVRSTSTLVAISASTVWSWNQVPIRQSQSCWCPFMHDLRFRFPSRNPSDRCTTGGCYHPWYE